MSDKTTDVLVELRVVIDGQPIISRKLVERRMWDALTRNRGNPYLVNLASAFAGNIADELAVRRSA